MDTLALLNKWRHLIEPEVTHGLTAVDWADVVRMPVMVVEGQQSVLVLRDVEIHGMKARSIWVAAGVMDEVLQLMDQAEEVARTDGIRNMVYMGRRGWVRAAGYVEKAVVGLKEL